MLVGIIYWYNIGLKRPEDMFLYVGLHELWTLPVAALLYY